MRKVFSFSFFMLAGAALATLSACSTAQKVQYKNEEFSSANTYAQVFPGSQQATCEAARRALLSQGYVIHEASASLIRGRKNFQPESNVHIQIEFHVVCAPNSIGSNSTTAFANAVRDRYSLKKSSTSASLGVGGLGSLSLPFGSSDDALVKVASETIPATQFYGRFFELMESYLDDSSINSLDEAEGDAASGKIPAKSSADPGS